MIARISSSSSGALVADELVALQLADAVLGADAAAGARRDRARCGSRRPSLPMKRRGASPPGADEVVVQVAVAEVAEYRRGATPGNAARSAAPASSRKRGNRGDRQRDVVLDVRSLAALRLADVLAQRPQRCGLLATARSSRRDDLRFDAARERRLDRAGAVAPSAPSSACSSTYQGWPGSGSGRCGWCLRDSASAKALISSKPTRRSRARRAAGRGVR